MSVCVFLYLVNYEVFSMYVTNTVGTVKSMGTYTRLRDYYTENVVKQIDTKFYLLLCSPHKLGLQSVRCRCFH